MTCPNCGKILAEGSAFCTKCGTKLETVQTPQPVSVEQNQVIQQQVTPVVTQEPAVPTAPVAQTVQPVQTTTAQPVTQPPKSEINYVKYIINAFIKPNKTFKEEEEKLKDTKNAFIFAGIIVGIMYVVNIVKTVIIGSISKTFNTTTFNYSTTVDFGRLQYLDWGEILIKKLLIYVGAIALIAGLYYVVNLIFKKTLKFQKLIVMAATCMLPYIASSMIVAPILGLLWDPLCVVFTIAGIVYSMIIFLSLVDEELNFENKDKKVYVHLICLAVIAVAGYYLYANLTVTSIVDVLKEWW